MCEWLYVRAGVGLVPGGLLYLPDWVQIGTKAVRTRAKKCLNYRVDLLPIESQCVPLVVNKCRVVNEDIQGPASNFCDLVCCGLVYDA